MFNFMVILYLALNVIYIVWVRRKVPLKDRENLLYVAGYLPVSSLSSKGVDKLLSSEERLKLSKLHPPRDLEEGTASYLSEKLGLVYLILAIGGLFAIAFGKDYIPSEPLDTIIERPGYGEESEDLVLSYQIEDGDDMIKQTLPMKVEARLPIGDDALAILEESALEIQDHMLTEGDVSDQVVHDMVFEKEPFEIPIQVHYHSMSPGYLTDKGELRRNSMEIGSSYPVTVKVTMTLSGLQMDNIYDFVLWRVPMTIEEEIALIEGRIETTDEHLVLPETLLERESLIHWTSQANGIRWYQIFALALALSAIVILFRKEKLNKALAERQEKILMDFPDVVSKLTMLINAGMTLTRAWQKIVTDYQDRGGGKRPLYEEMLITTSQIQNGMAEREALEAFGKRTGTKEVIRLSAMLIQNLRRGSHSLTEALKQLSQEAWEVRTTSARIQGEKASTKLLLPMGISFITVIIIVIAPTLMSMSI